MLAISTQELTRIIPNLFETIAAGQDVIITHQDRPIAKIIAIRPFTSVADMFADIRGKATFSVDLDEPTSDEWALS